MKKVIIIGAGLAGCEAALTLARFGIGSTIYEQKPQTRSYAHKSDNFSELVCSNSLRSADLNSGIGLLKNEMRALNSPFMSVADNCSLPAGKALAVDREKFSRQITDMIIHNPNIKVINKQIGSLDEAELLGEDKLIIMAAGPMLSENLADSLANFTGQDNCYFYDAIAPIVWASSINKDRAFVASRYEHKDENSGESGDYINCPMNRDEYNLFYEELLKGEIFKGHDDEPVKHFEGCMPIEALAARGPKTLVFGPFKPVGLIDPRTQKRPWAVVQLRAESVNKEAYNLVGCQTKLLQKEQRRIFGLIPGLENAEFLRYGSMHRNTYINAPETLNLDLSLKTKANCFIAGQLSGVEGYVESAASGHWLALQIKAILSGEKLDFPPNTTAIGALLAHLQRPVKKFQPSNINFGLMPEIKGKKKERKALYKERAENDFKKWLQKNKM